MPVMFERGVVGTLGLMVKHNGIWYLGYIT
jgi:hypothetical protein